MTSKFDHFVFVLTQGTFNFKHGMVYPWFHEVHGGHSKGFKISFWIALYIMQHVWQALFNLQLCFCRSEVWKSNRFGIIFLWWHQKTKRHVKTPYSFWKLKIENFMLYTLWIHVIMKQLRLYQFGFWNLATFDICGNNDFLGIGYERPRSVVDYGGCCQLRTGAPPPNPLRCIHDRF